MYYCPKIWQFEFYCHEAFQELQMFLNKGEFISKWNVPNHYPEIFQLKRRIVFAHLLEDWAGVKDISE